MLVAFSTYQGEFDYRVPLFSVVELPVLLCAAAALALVPARIALGRGGALAVVLVFLCLRGGVAALVGVLAHTAPRLPLYLAAAAGIEVVAWVLGTTRRLRFALVAGAIVGTAGLALEWSWASAVGGHHLPPAAWPVAGLLALAAAMAAAVLGAWLAQVVAGAATGIGRPAVVVAGVGLVVCVLVPLPRHVGEVDAVISLDRTAEPTQVTVELHPPGAARRATVFEVLAVQGGGTVHAPLEKEATGMGRYRTTRAVPVGGDWKTFVALYRDDEVMAAPISLPADPDIGAAAVPATPERRVAFTSIVSVLLREAHGGPVWPAAVAYLALGAVFVTWLGFLGRAVRRLRPDEIAPPAGRSVDRDAPRAAQ